MTTYREGYRNLTIQLPEILCAQIDAIAEQKRMSVTAIITEELCRVHKIPLARIPPRRKTGPKRKPRKASN